MRALRFGIPLAVFVLLVFFLGRGLWRDPREIPSVLVDKPVPAFTLPVLGSPDKKFSPADYRGKVWLLNVWGSWCISCQVEHPTLLALAKSNVVPIVGFDWKDKPDAAIKWLAQQGGDPYVFSVTDLDGRVAIDFGVYGAPETFVIDKEGMIRYKHIGPLDDKAVAEKLLPWIRKLNS
ncbi:MAG: DsbE family thiol:disulfide interchange protein [Betaproteobacteria bacterium]|nr:DsbE family thiol:disulfide interchange protein [Betaproteobacteria bacterium]